MITTRWVFYSTATGLMDGRVVYGDEDAATVNAPAGYAPLASEVDPARHRVDLSGPEPVVVSYVPPAPPDDAMRTWAWRDDLGRWMPVPTLAARIADRVATVDVDLADIERRQARPLGDILAALTAGGAPSPDDVAMLAQLRGRAAAARVARTAMAAATDDQQLAAVQWPPP